MESMTKKQLNVLLLQICAMILESDPKELSSDEEVTAWGLDSVATAMIHDLIQNRLLREGVEFPYNDFISYATIDELSEALIQNRMLRTGDLAKVMIDIPAGNDQPQSLVRSETKKTKVLKKFDADENGFRFQELGFSAPGHKTRYNGKSVISFASNDYLSLVKDPGVQAAAEKAVREYGTGCGSSMLGSGSLTIHKALADELADFLGKESVLLMPAGYMAMLGFCSARILSGHTLFSDALNHRSIIDGLRLGKGASERKDAFHFFNHNSVRSLQQIRSVVRSPGSSEFPDIVVLEGVYSMDGDRGALDEFVPYCKDQGMQIAIDDAHGIGVLGNHGRGTADEYQKTVDVDYILGTFSKSFATAGGFIAGAEDAIDELRQQSSQYMFSASLTPSVVETARYVLRLLQKDNRRQVKLWDNINYLKSCLSELDLNTMNSNSAIFPVLVNSEEKALDCARQLADQKGLFVLPVIYPVVPKGKARLRISVNAGHSRSDISFLADSISEILKVTDI
jgi:8-amino-7-oxononanoate synthase